MMYTICSLESIFIVFIVTVFISNYFLAKKDCNISNMVASFVGKDFRFSYKEKNFMLGSVKSEYLKSDVSRATCYKFFINYTCVVTCYELNGVHGNMFDNKVFVYFNENFDKSQIISILKNGYDEMIHNEFSKTVSQNRKETHEVKKLY